jgi:hypothetical protein
VDKVSSRSRHEHGPTALSRETENNIYFGYPINYIIIHQESNMKKYLVSFTLVAATLAAPALAFAQSNAPVTRAQVRADLVAVEKAGYNPALASDPYYPSDIQAAEAKVATQHAGAAQAYGGVQTGTSASSAPKHVSMNNTCVGPIDFCQLFFGS